MFMCIYIYIYIYICNMYNMYNMSSDAVPCRGHGAEPWQRSHAVGTPNPPTNIVPTNIKLSGKSPMDMKIPPL